MQIRYQHIITRVTRTFVTAAVALFISCDEQIDWEMKYQETDLLVVEAKITNEARQHEVKLSMPFYEMNGTPLPVSDAVVEINDGTEIHTLQEDPDTPGTYLTDSLFAARLNQYYQLRITRGRQTVTAVTRMIAVTPFQRMTVYPVQEDPPLLSVHIADSDEPAIVRGELDWSLVPGYEGLPDTATHAIIYHYTLPGVDVNKIFKPGQEQVRFPPGTRVFREKESVSPQYAEYLRGVLSETDWRGGMFDVLPGNARTNLVGNAIGFFAAAEVIRDTIEIE